MPKKKKPTKEEVFKDVPKKKRGRKKKILTPAEEEARRLKRKQQAKARQAKKRERDKLKKIEAPKEAKATAQMGMEDIPAPIFKKKKKETITSPVEEEEEEVIVNTDPGVYRLPDSLFSTPSDEEVRHYVDARPTFSIPLVLKTETETPLEDRAKLNQVTRTGERRDYYRLVPITDLDLSDEATTHYAELIKAKFPRKTIAGMSKVTVYLKTWKDINSMVEERLVTAPSFADSADERERRRYAQSRETMYGYDSIVKFPGDYDDRGRYSMSRSAADTYAWSPKYQNESMIPDMTASDFFNLEQQGYSTSFIADMPKIKAEIKLFSYGEDGSNRSGRYQWREKSVFNNLYFFIGKKLITTSRGLRRSYTQDNHYRGRGSTVKGKVLLKLFTEEKLSSLVLPEPFRSAEFFVSVRVAWKEYQKKVWDKMIVKVQPGYDAAKRAIKLPDGELLGVWGDEDGAQVPVLEMAGIKVRGFKLESRVKVIQGQSIPATIQTAYPPFVMGFEDWDELSGIMEKLVRTDEEGDWYSNVKAKELVINYAAKRKFRWGVVKGRKERVMATRPGHYDNVEGHWKTNKDTLVLLAQRETLPPSAEVDRDLHPVAYYTDRDDYVRFDKKKHPLMYKRILQWSQLIGEDMGASNFYKNKERYKVMRYEGEIDLDLVNPPPGMRPEPYGGAEDRQPWEILYFKMWVIDLRTGKLYNALGFKTDSNDEPIVPAVYENLFQWYLTADLKSPGPQRRDGNHLYEPGDVWASVSEGLLNLPMGGFRSDQDADPISGLPPIKAGSPLQGIADEANAIRMKKLFVINPQTYPREPIKKAKPPPPIRDEMEDSDSDSDSWEAYEYQLADGRTVYVDSKWNAYNENGEEIGVVDPKTKTLN